MRVQSILIHTKQLCSFLTQSQTMAATSWDWEKGFHTSIGSVIPLNLTSTLPEAHGDVKLADLQTVFKVKTFGSEEKWSLHIFQFSSAVMTSSSSGSCLDRPWVAMLCLQSWLSSNSIMKC